MNILNTSVMHSLVGATTMMKMTDISMGIYQQAKCKGDLEKMNKAFGYTAEIMEVATKYADRAGDALKEAQREARKKSKAEQEAALAEKRQAKAPAKKAAEAEQQTANQALSVDVVEISNKAQAAFINNTRFSVSKSS